MSRIIRKLTHISNALKFWMDIWL